MPPIYVYTHAYLDLLHDSSNGLYRLGVNDSSISQVRSSGWTTYLPKTRVERGAMQAPSKARSGQS